jgi:putative transcriptional regulator
MDDDHADSLSGSLLVAAPALRDPNFERAVVLLLEHGDAGALGVVLNRPTDTDVFAALPRWNHLAAAPPVLFAGGPVAPTAAICLARGETPRHAAGEEVEGWRPLFDGVGTVDLERDPDDLAADVHEVRVFAGYAGWGPEQLEGEVATGAWYVFRALAGDVVSPAPGDLWRTVLRRQGGNLAMVANFPADPAMN